MARKSVIRFWCCAVVLLVWGSRAHALGVLDQKLDLKTIEKMAATGQVIHLEYKGGVLQYRMVCTLIDAPLDKVWKALTDFENYHKFTPEMMPPKVTKISSTEFRADFTLQIEIYGPLKTTQKYSVQYNLEKPVLYMHDPKGPRPPRNKANFWKLAPAGNGKKTLVFYFDKAPDLKDLGSFVHGIVKDRPELALALQVSPVSIQVQELKKYVEKKK